MRLRTIRYSWQDVYLLYGVKPVITCKYVYCRKKARRQLEDTFVSIGTTFKFIFICFTLWLILWLLHVVNHVITWLWHFFLCPCIHTFGDGLKSRNTKTILKRSTSLRRDLHPVFIILDLVISHFSGYLYRTHNYSCICKCTISCTYRATFIDKSWALIVHLDYRLVWPTDQFISRLTWFSYIIHAERVLSSNFDKST